MRTEKQAEKCFENCLYFSLGKIYRIIDRIAFDAFREIKLSPSHAFILMTIHESPSHKCTSNDISRILDLDPSTVTRLITSLEKLKYISKEKCGKYIFLELTKNGNTLLPKIRTAWSKLHTAYNLQFGSKLSSELNTKINLIRNHMEPK